MRLTSSTLQVTSLEAVSKSPKGKMMAELRPMVHLLSSWRPQSLLCSRKRLLLYDCAHRLVKKDVVTAYTKDLFCLGIYFLSHLKILNQWTNKFLEIDPPNITALQYFLEHISLSSFSTSRKADFTSGIFLMSSLRIF